MRAGELLKHNIKALLKARHQTQRDLAQWCRRDESWLGHALNEPQRGIPIQYLDRIADFFGIATYQLLQPGISALTERRVAERRKGRDRRLGHTARVMLGPVAAELARVRGARSADAETHTPGADPLRALVAEFEERAAALLADEARRQAPDHRGTVPASPPPVRPARGSRPPKA
jgi:hypothetical protein